jgi:hypothetical protein
MKPNRELSVDSIRQQPETDCIPESSAYFPPVVWSSPMFSLFAHHAESYFAIEIAGRDFPDGPTEHVIGAAIAISVLVFMSYGIYAGVRDFLRWRRRPVEVKA